MDIRFDFAISPFDAHDFFRGHFVEFSRSNNDQSFCVGWYAGWYSRFLAREVKVEQIENS